MKCKTLVTTEQGKRIENLEIFPLEPRGAVFLGVEHMNNAESIKRGQFSEIRSAIRHGHSYRGGGFYGEFGGYDITLITLATPLSGQRACLPRLQFEDEGHDRGKLAGYGMYTRKKNKCLTNQYGKMKYHYCKDVSIKVTTSSYRVPAKVSIPGTCRFLPVRTSARVQEVWSVYVRPREGRC